MILRHLVVGLILLFYEGERSRALRITPPKRLGPGETRVQAPGWQHCIRYLKARWRWQRIRNDNYPKFGGKQLQCSWIVEAPIGWKVKIAFQDLHMQGPVGSTCRAQYIEVIDLGTGKTQGRFCGTNPPGDYVSAGTLLRMDLQGDKSGAGYRGFILRYRFVRERPGFRDRRTFYTSRSTSPGKADISKFLSTQQKRLNARPRVGARPPGRVVYASDRKITSTSAPTVRPDSGWLGDDGSQSGPQSTQRRRVAGGARITARPRPRITPRNSNGNRITAINRRNTNANSGSSDNSVPSSEADGWVRSPSDGTPAPSSKQGYYGRNNQPDYGSNSDASANSKSRNTIMVVHKEGGLSTTNLIIIVVAVVVCLLIVVAAFLVKRFCFPGRQPKTENKDRKKQKTVNTTSQDGMDDTVNRHQSLPGFSKSASVHSLHSLHAAPTTNNELGSRKISRQATPLPPVPPGSLRISKSVRCRHQSQRPTAQGMPTLPQPIYYNEPMTSLKRNSMQRQRDVRFKRHLPARPSHLKTGNDIEEDEDYCSGSETGGDITTLRRVYSKWEMEQKKKTRK